MSGTHDRIPDVSAVFVIVPLQTARSYGVLRDNVSTRAFPLYVTRPNPLRHAPCASAAFSRPLICLRRPPVRYSRPVLAIILHYRFLP